MAIDTRAYKNKLRSKQARISLVPLIDVIFTILIFLMVTSSFQAVSDSAGGKPEISDTSGSLRILPDPHVWLAHRHCERVNMSSYIRNSAIAVHTNVIDQGEITIKPKEGLITIVTPPGMPLEKAVSTQQ